MVSDDARAVLEAAFLKELTARNKTTRAGLQDTLNPGDRRTVWLEGREIGTVARDRPSTGWRVTDRDTFTAWVKAEYPEATVTTVTVVPAWEKEFLTSPVDRVTGEVPPGLEEVTSSPRLVVSPNAVGVSEAVEMLDGSMPQLEVNR